MRRRKQTAEAAAPWTPRWRNRARAPRQRRRSPGCIEEVDAGGGGAEPEVYQSLRGLEAVGHARRMGARLGGGAPRSAPFAGSQPLLVGIGLQQVEPDLRLARAGAAD